MLDDPGFLQVSPASVIVILGQTASGKSRFAIELANKLDSVIISADAFQVYKDFSVATDKILPHEMDGIRHYGIDIVDPGSEFTVKDFLVYAIPLIEFELKNGRSPIVVGGTHMYIEKLLFTSRLDENIEVSKTEKITRPEANLHSYLKQVDAVMAAKLHPNDIRRVSRAIEFFEQSGGRLMSDELANQVRVLRFPHTLVLCKEQVSSELLSVKIRERIESKMLRNNALLDEIERIRVLVAQGQLQWEKGLLQAIGYREFNPRLAATHQNMEEIFESIVLHTTQYSKKQAKWIKKIEKSIPIHRIVDLNQISNILK